MPQHFMNFGLNAFKDEKTFLQLLGFINEQGQTFVGYKCKYIYKSIGQAEMIATVEHSVKDDNFQLIGFNNHLIGSCIWKLKVSAPEILRSSKQDDPYSYVVCFKGLDGHGLLPINIIHADVVPSFLENDVVDLQVAAFPYEISYVQDEEASDKFFDWQLMGKKLRFADGIFPQGIFSKDEEAKDIVLLKGMVKGIEHLATFDGQKAVQFLVATIDTQFGLLEIVHTLDMVSIEQREFIKPGCFLVGIGIVSGDVAIYEFQQGAVYDEENCLRLLRSCMKYGDWDRLQNALVEDCVYRRVDGDITGKNEVLAKFSEIFEQIATKGDEFYSFLATVGKVDGNTKFEIGKRCLAMSYKEPDNIGGFLFLSMTSDGKIQAIDQSSVEGDVYHVRLDLPEPEEEEESYTPIRLERTAEEWLELIKSGYDELNFELKEFFFGMELSVILTAPDLDEDLTDKEKVFLYFANKVKCLKESGRDLITEIIRIADGSPGLLIIDGNEKFTMAVELSERGRIAKLKIEVSE